jgi:hypothetical protein
MLEVLDLSGCQDIEFSPDILNKLNIKFLDLSGTHFHQIEELYRLQKLEALHIDKCIASKVSQKINSVTKEKGKNILLREARENISEDIVKSANKALSRIKNLRTLGIHVKDIQLLHLPSSSFKTLQHVQKLNITGRLEEEDVAMLTQFAKNAPNLQTIVLEEDFVTTHEEFVAHLFESINRGCPGNRAVRLEIQIRDDEEEDLEIQQALVNGMAALNLAIDDIKREQTEKPTEKPEVSIHQGVSGQQNATAEKTEQASKGFFSRLFGR